MKKHDFVNIQGFSEDDLLYLIRMAREFEKHPNRELLKGKIVATLFYEPSTRTRLSFETAANRLGAKVIGFTDAKVSSVSKGETLKDTILMVSNYADVIAMRHYIEGAAQYASEVAPVPIINAWRRCPSASVAVSARPLYDIPDTGHAEQSEHLSCRRP